MAVAIDALSNATPATGNLSWTHTPVGTPKGVVVRVMQNGDSANYTTGVTYGGVALTQITGSPQTKTTGEFGVVSTWLLGSGVPTGAQTVAITVSDTVTSKSATCTTLTAAANIELNASVALTGDAVANPSTTLGLGGISSLVMLHCHSGQAAVTGCTPLAGWTSQYEFDAGSAQSIHYSYDTVGTADVTVGFTQTADDVIMLAVAYKEAAASGPTLLTASDTLTPSVTDVSTVDVVVVTTDTLTPSVTESQEIMAGITASDTLIPSLTESQVSLLASILTDTLTPSVSELLDLLSRSDTADTLTPSISDISAIGVVVAATDTLTPSVTETTIMLAAMLANEIFTPSLTESQSSLLTSSLVETLTPSVTETQEVMAGLTAADTLTPSVTELAEVIAALLVSEVLTPSLTEVQNSLLFSNLSETFAPTLTESQASLLSSSVADTLTPSVTDVSVVAVLLSVLETLTPSVTELTEVIAALSLVDSLTPSVTESQNSLLFSVLTEVFAPSLTESQSSLLLSSLVETLGLSITDTALAAAVVAATLSQADIDAVANAVWSKVIESGMSSADILRIILSAVSGRTAGVGTSTEKYKSVDLTVDRVSVSFDADNNRTSVTRDGSFTS